MKVFNYRHDRTARIGRRIALAQLARRRAAGFESPVRPTLIDRLIGEVDTRL